LERKKKKAADIKEVSAPHAVDTTNLRAVPC
jgi:hypothetical protein